MRSKERRRQILSDAKIAIHYGRVALDQFTTHVNAIKTDLRDTYNKAWSFYQHPEFWGPLTSPPGLRNFTLDPFESNSTGRGKKVWTWADAPDVVIGPTLGMNRLEDEQIKKACVTVEPAGKALALGHPVPSFVVDYKSTTSSEEEHG